LANLGTWSFLHKRRSCEYRISKKKSNFSKKIQKITTLKKQKISKISKISKKKNYGKKSKNFVGEILFLAIFFTTFSMKRGVWQIIMNALPSYDEMK
jgi:hypothetical protein